MYILLYNFELRHIQRKHNVITDTFLRRPHHDDDSETERADKFINDMLTSAATVKPIARTSNLGGKEHRQCLVFDIKADAKPFD